MTKSRSRGRAVCGLVAAVLALLCAGVALAQVSPEREAEAKEHNRAGLALIDQGRISEAAEEFKNAYALNPLPRYLFNTAKAYDMTGQARKALDCYQRFLGETISDEERERVGQTVAELKKRMARLTVTVEPATAILKVDGDAELCRPGVECLVDPGPHVMELSAAGYLPTSRKLKLDVGETHREQMVLVPEVETFERGAVVWRSALFPGLGQLYADRDAWGYTFVCAEALALAGVATGFVLQSYYTTERDKESGEDWEDWNDYVDKASTLTLAASITAAAVWALNLGHALSMDLTKAGPGQAAGSSAALLSAPALVPDPGGRGMAIQIPW